MPCFSKRIDGFPDGAERPSKKSPLHTVVWHSVPFEVAFDPGTLWPGVEAPDRSRICRNPLLAAPIRRVAGLGPKMNGRAKVDHFFHELEPNDA